MVAWIVKNFGGTIPRQDSRLLPDTMAEIAVDVDLSRDELSGLAQPEFIVDLSAAAPWPVRKAYRFPGPAVGQPDVWLPLPSEFSSVVRSPLADDTLHRIYWTNPPGSPGAGAWWNTYDRIAAGNVGANAPWALGFTAPDPGITPYVTVSGGTYPGYTVYGASAVDRGVGYVPGEILTVHGGTLAQGVTQPFSVRIATTTALNIQLLGGPTGSGGTDGGAVLTGTTGTGVLLEIYGTITGGSLVSIGSIVNQGAYTTNPANATYDTLAGAGLSGALVGFQMGVWGLDTPTDALYSTVPADPAPTAVSGTGSGCTISLQYVSNGAPPLVERSYCFTYIDQYGAESSPSNPSVVVAGPSDATWTVSGLPTAAPSPPAGANYPPVDHMRIYRTLTAAGGAAQFYMVADNVPFGSGTYVDTVPDTTIVNNNLLQTASWAPPLAGLDGLTAMPGGMLIGFTGNTIHFCEQDYPHTWPAGYDQSLLYPIVGFAVWQQNLVVLTQGYPSQGSGTSPAQFFFSQVQAPEPCIARGSIVTDLAGVYYASQNGLIMLNYFGMQNQTLSNMTRTLWLTEFNAAQIIACRHRAQYLAINGTGMGFMIDYTEQRMGIVKISPFVDVVSVWNDVYVGDAYMCAAGRVYRWDSTNTPPLIYQWRSKQFYLPAPSSLGACQISLDPAVAYPAPTAVVPPPISGASELVLPPGINALFRLFVGPNGQNMILEQWLTEPRMIFRLPSGRKAFNWQFEIVSRVGVHSVELASTMRELKKV
jgi:hypothetical protein